MLESKLLRGNIDFVVEQLKRRNFSFDVKEFNELEDQRKSIQVQTQDLQNLRNTKSKSIGQAKASGENIEPLLAEVSELGEKLDNAKDQLQEIQSKISEIVLSMPNIPHSSVPEGNTEDENEEVFSWPLSGPTQFDFEPKEYKNLNKTLNKILFKFSHEKNGGAKQDRTADLLDANQALSQLSYSPN